MHEIQLFLIHIKEEKLLKGELNATLEGLACLCSNTDSFKFCVTLVHVRFDLGSRLK